MNSEDKVAFEPYMDKLVMIVYNDDFGEKRTMKGVIREVTKSFIVLRTLRKCYTYRFEQIQRVQLWKDNP